MASPGGPLPVAARLRAHAKINLCLRVLGRRPDGFHDVRTVMQTVSLSDSLRVAVRPGTPSVELSCNIPALRGRANLAWRAADTLLRRAGARAAVSIRLRKAIPVGAGLGGGSSDAAAVLRAMGALLPRRPAPGLLAEVAAGLGSDVPFFLLGGTALATGRGTRLESLDDLDPVPLVIARPDVEVSTAWAYGALARDRSALPPGTAGGRIVGTGSETWTPGDPCGQSGLDNDFEAVVFRRFAGIGTLKRRLSAAGARVALMTGSGSAVFGVFNTSQLARAVARTLRAEGIQAWPASYVSKSDSARVQPVGERTSEGEATRAH